MELEKVEKLIDRAIDEGDFEKVLRLLDERERILKGMDIDEKTARELIRRDEERMKKIESMKKSLLESAFKSRKLTDHFQSFRNTGGGRTWGKG